MEGEEPSLNIETAEPQLDNWGGGPLRWFAEGIWLSETDPTHLLDRPPWAQEEVTPTPVRASSIVTIDGRPVEFDLVFQPTEWVGRASYGGYVITIEGHNFPRENLRLVRVKDVTPYIEGTLALFSSWEQDKPPH